MEDGTEKQAKPTVRIQVASDLHLEFRKGPCEDLVASTGAPLLALVGDIGWPASDAYASFLAAMTGRYERVFVVPGNHEYYGTADDDESPTMDHIARSMRAACERHSNVSLLDDAAVVVGGVRYIGSTLWSHIPAALEPRCTSGMNDYHLIRVNCDNDDDDTLEGARKTARLTVQDTNALHAAAVEFIDGQLHEAAVARQPAVVLTHHAPSFRSIHRRYALSPFTCAFATDLEATLMRPPVALWLHGHTHAACDYVLERRIGGDGEGRLHRVRVVNNPAGYPGEADTGYRRDLVVEVDLDGA